MSKYVECSKAFEVIDNTVELYYSELEAIMEALEKVASDSVKKCILGRWIRYPECGVTKCSICSWSIEEAWDFKFCPNCGAKMNELED